jgi:hypothetical protein
MTMLGEDRSFWVGLRNGIAISVWLWAFLLWLVRLSDRRWAVIGKCSIVCLVLVEFTNGRRDYLSPEGWRYFALRGEVKRVIESETILVRESGKAPLVPAYSRT